MGQEEIDEEIMVARIGGEVVYTFTMPQWKILCGIRGARAKVPRAAEQGGAIAVHALLRDIFEQEPPAPEAIMPIPQVVPAEPPLAVA